MSTMLRFTAAVLLCGACAASAQAAAPRYRLVLLDGVANGGVPTAINNAGVVVGEAYTGSENRAFSWQGGRMTLLPGEMAVATAISDQGHIAGASQMANPEPGVFFIRPMLYHQGTLSTLPEAFPPDPSVPGWSSYTGATGVNSAGTVLVSTSNNLGNGAYTYANGTTTVLPMDSGVAINEPGQVAGTGSGAASGHAVLYGEGRLLDLGGLPDHPGSGTVPTDLNDAGAVVGYGLFGPASAQRVRSFLYADGLLRVIGDPGEDSMASAINNRGDMVGYLYHNDGTGMPHAYLYQDGVQTSLDALIVDASGLHMRYAGDINDAGQIVGQACDMASTCFAALLTPVPEPQTGAMLLAGAAVLGWAGRRRAARQAGF